MCNAMPRYIDADAAVDAIEGITSNMSVCVNKDECHGMKRMQRQAVLEVANMPAADVAPIRHGRWEWDEEMGVFLCSLCGNGWKEQPTLMGKPLYEWCPVCGAKMDVGDGDD